MRPPLFAALILVSAWGPARATTGSLVGQINVSSKPQYADIWGWVDPATGRRYALVGNNGSALHIVDVTNPTLPFEVAAANSVPRFDMKTLGSLVYSVNGLVGSTGAILDITTPSSPVVVGSFPGGHNIFIEDAGYLYVSLPGLKIYDLNPDPTAPRLVWDDPMSDGQDGHDVTVIGNTLYEFRGTYGIRFWDVTDRHTPVPLGAIVDSTLVYAHNGWPTEDGRHLFITDEFSRHPAPDITVWDISNFAAPRRVAGIGDPNSTAHNCYVVGDLLYVAYYVAGFRLYDVSNPTNPVLVYEYDTSPLSGEGIFEGAFGVYPFGPDNLAYVNDRPSGLFVFQIEQLPTGVRVTPSYPPALELHGGAPNPFGASTSIRYSLGAQARVSASIFDAAGRLVRRLPSGVQPAGEHTVTWDGRDDAGRSLASGVYFCRVRAGEAERAGRLVLLR